MIVRINEIPQDGLNVTGQIQPNDISDPKEDYIQFTEPLTVKAKVQKFDEILLVHAVVTGTFDSYCSRSLQPLTGTIRREFDLDFDVDELQETELDIGEDIRQEVILDLPLKLVIGEDSKELQKRHGITILTELDAKAQPPKFVEDQDVIEQPEQKTHQPFLGLKDIDH